MNSLQRCDGVTRRDLLRVGGLTALGLGLGDFFRLQHAFADEPSTTQRAKSCILIWLDGGPSHIESFDPKPNAPEEVRGPLQTIATSVSGVRVSECFERIATIFDKLSIIRSMTSPLGEHNFGTHYLMTGYKPSPALAYPTMGATVAHLNSSTGVLPPNIAVPRFTGKVSGNGYPPAATQPFSVGGTSRGRGANRSNLVVRDLDFYRGLDLTRLNRRRQIVRAFDDFSRAQDAATPAVSDPDLERAYNLIASPRAKRAFSLSEEPDAVRQRYGFGSDIGQSCLMARRLVERGVPFVTVNNTGWDSHQDIIKLKERYPGDKNAPLLALDRALTALIGDLADRRLLDQTLVVVMGEFGRTPKINPAGGRDHWPNVFSVALAGGGTRGGQVVGSSDVLGESPKANPVTPADLAATIYTLLGIDPNRELHTADGRPVRIARDGARVVEELIG